MMQIFLILTLTVTLTLTLTLAPNNPDPDPDSTPNNSNPNPRVRWIGNGVGVGAWVSGLGFGVGVGWGAVGVFGGNNRYYDPLNWRTLHPSTPPSHHPSIPPSPLLLLPPLSPIHPRDSHEHHPTPTRCVSFRVGTAQRSISRPTTTTWPVPEPSLQRGRASISRIK